MTGPPPPDSQAPQDDVVLLKAFADAIKTVPSPVPVYFPPDVLMSVISHVQLALRHPNVHRFDAAADHARAFVETAKQAFPPLIQEIIEMGDQPEYDVSINDDEIEVEIPVDWTRGEST